MRNQSTLGIVGALLIVAGAVFYAGAAGADDYRLSDLGIGAMFVCAGLGVLTLIARFIEWSVKENRRNAAWTEARDRRLERDREKTSPEEA